MTPLAALTRRLGGGAVGKGLPHDRHVPNPGIGRVVGNCPGRLTGSPTAASAALRAEIDAHTVQLLDRAQQEGVLAPDADLEWTRQVYYALLGEALSRPGADQGPAAQDPDAQATLVIDTLLHGAGPRG